MPTPKQSRTRYKKRDTDVTGVVKRHERGKTARKEILKISLDTTLYKKILKWVNRC